MSDSRRLSTSDVLALGIINKPPVTLPIPEGREEFEFDEDGDEKALEALRSDKVLTSSNYYGIPHLWKQDEKWRGILLQYRSITEDETFTSEAEAFDWFKEKHAETYG